MIKLTPLLLVIFLTGCFGPSTLDTTNKDTIKSTIEKINESLPINKKEQLSKAISYYSLGGSKGVATMLKNAFNNKRSANTTDALFIENLHPLHGKTADEILALYKKQLTADKIEKEERSKVRKLSEEAETFLTSNKFKEALSKYKDMSLLKSGIKASEEGIAKINLQIKSFEEKANYIEKIKVTEFISTRIDTYTKKGVAAVRIGLKNTGIRSLDKVKVTVYFQDKNGNNIYEQDFNPVLVSKYTREKPLKPGYSYEMEKNNYKIIKAPLTDWSEGKATMKIVDISFSN